MRIDKDGAVAKGIDAVEEANRRMQAACDRMGGCASLPTAEHPPTERRSVAPMPSAAVRMAARAASWAMCVAVVASLLGATCSSLPPRDNCQPRTFRCRGATPEVCSHEGRWHLSGDQACRAGTVCILAPDGRSGCGRAPAATDGGTATDGGVQ